MKAHSSNYDTISIELINQEDLVKYQSALPISASEDHQNNEHIGRNAEFFTDLKIGDSVSIDGVCLTVVQLDKSLLSFDVNLAPETLFRTNLGSLKVHDLVNLERALSSSTRFGGHFVQGHIDKTGKIVNKTQDKDSIRITIEYGQTNDSNAEFQEKGYSKYLIPKGYVTIDGISLTITSIDNQPTNTFSIMLIPHTQLNVTLSLKTIGSTVNLEFDMLVKSIVNVIEFSLKDQLERIVQQTFQSQIHLLQHSKTPENNPSDPRNLSLD